jgi:hypothetical protein
MESELPERAFARRKEQTRFVPEELIGDWIFVAGRSRFNYDGTYSLVTISPYTIEDERTLHLMSDTYERIAGTTGLQGRWLCEFPEDKHLEITFGPYGFYSYVWDNGDSGGMCYWNDENTVAIVELRSYVDCSGSNITFTRPNGTPMTGTFHVTDDTLELTIGGGIITYTRLPFAINLTGADSRR